MTLLLVLLQFSRPERRAKPSLPTPYKMVRNNIIAAATALATAATAAAAVPNTANGLPTFEKMHMVETAVGKVEYVTKAERDAMHSKGKHFIDITKHPNLASDSRVYAKRAVEYPTELAFQEEVNTLIGQLSKENLQTALKTYSDYETRYYETDTGIAAAKWLLEQVQKTIADSGVEGAEASAYKHSDWEQISIIAKIPGKKETKVVVGAHLDSINGDDELGRSPGAGMSIKFLF